MLHAVEQRTQAWLPNDEKVVVIVLVIVERVGVAQLISEQAGGLPIEFDGTKVADIIAIHALERGHGVAGPEQVRLLTDDKRVLYRYLVALVESVVESHIESMAGVIVPTAARGPIVVIFVAVLIGCAELSSATRPKVQPYPRANLEAEALALILAKIRVIRRAIDVVVVKATQGSFHTPGLIGCANKSGNGGRLDR